MGDSKSFETGAIFEPDTSEDPNNAGQLMMIISALDLGLNQHCALINLEKRLAAMPIPVSLKREREGLLQDVLALLTMSETLRKTLDSLYAITSLFKTIDLTMMVQ